MLQRRKSLRSGIERAPERRWRKHAQFVRGFVCLACKAAGTLDEKPPRRIEAAHVRTGTDGGTGIKPADWWLVPLCTEHHAEQHQIGESAFERRYGVDLKKEATRLARLSPDKAMHAVMTEAGLQR